MLLIGYKTVQNRRLKGCLKNVSTIIEIEKNGEKNSYIKEKKINFVNAEQSEGESPGSNIYSGCPIDLETSNSAVQFLGYGYLVVDIIETLPIEYQSAEFLLIDMDLRTEYSTGILFYDFVLFNFNYVMIRLKEGNNIEIQFKTICKYNDPFKGDPNEYTTLNMNLNQTFYLGEEITNGYWFNLAVKFDFKQKNFEVRVNNTVKARENLFTPLTIKKPLIFDTIEEMKSIVCDKQIRPSCPNRWQSSEVRSVELFMRLVTSSVTRFGNFGKNLKIFGSIFNVYFIFGKVLNQF